MDRAQLQNTQRCVFNRAELIWVGALPEETCVGFPMNHLLCDVHAQQTNGKKWTMEATWPFF